MLDWYIEVSELLRDISDTAEAIRKRLLDDKGKSMSIFTIKGDLNRLTPKLKKIWGAAGRDIDELSNVLRHLGLDARELKEATDFDIPGLITIAKKHAKDAQIKNEKLSFYDLLHPEIQRHALHHFINGHLREAVLNSVMAITEMIRSRTNSTLDGQQLANETFSSDRPRLIFSEIETESGKSDQKGFMQIFAGMYVGIRNPKAHTLTHNLNQTTAAQYLIFASLLARRIDEAKFPPEQVKNA